MTTSTSTISLYNSGVNGGTSVNLNGGEFTYEMKALIGIEPAPGKFGVVEVNNNGYENPKLVIRGYVDADSDVAGTNIVTKAHLCNFLTSTNQNYLIIRYGNPGNETILTKIDNSYETVGGYSAIPIVIEKINLKSISGSRNGHVLSFDITCYEDA